MHVTTCISQHAWTAVTRAARTTIHHEGNTREPSASWKKRILLAEHSPIRKLRFSWQWRDLLSWVSVHFVRHHVGILHFVSTQRTDRTGVDRNALPQSAFVWHECEANAQAMISISRKRLCAQASPETRQAWQAVIDELATHEPELASVCVPECLYRGFCPELTSCGYAETEAYQTRLKEYRNV